MSNLSAARTQPHRFRTWFFAITILHVVFLFGLLIASGGHPEVQKLEAPSGSGDWSAHSASSLPPKQPASK
jgi:hypothetical protein